MNRLVTKEDIAANPELSKKGVSVNQRYNFPDEDLAKDAKAAAGKKATTNPKVVPQKK